MRTTFGVHMKGGVITEMIRNFCGRLVLRADLPGIMSVEQMRGIAAIAKKYGARNLFTAPHDRRLKFPMSIRSR